MKFCSTSKRYRMLGVPAVGLMLLLWLGAFALTASPQLHRLFHRDAQSANHHCLVTQLQQHSLWASFSLAVAPVTPTLGLWYCFFDFQVLSHSVIGLYPGI